jgi:tRNA A37 threonylcarbamoyladenosine dehydratase
MTTRYDSIIRSYGHDGFERIQSAQILVVGAGGIGCEVGIRLSVLYLITPYCMLDLCNFPCRY